MEHGNALKDRRLLTAIKSIWTGPRPTGLSFVFLYLVAIVSANLIVTQFGPMASIPTAFVLIGFDLSSRDRLHDLWHGRGLTWKMAILIASGSLISFLINNASGRIGLASMISFAVSSVVDTLVYASLGKKSYLIKSNGSNLVSSAFDSILFPTLAFGSFLPIVISAQFFAKEVGGFGWSLAFRGIARKAEGRVE